MHRAGADAKLCGRLLLLHAGQAQLHRATPRPQRYGRLGNDVGIPWIGMQPPLQALPGRIPQMLHNLLRGHRRREIQLHRPLALLATEHGNNPSAQSPRKRPQPLTSIEVRHRPQEMDKLTEGTSQHLTTLTRSQLEKDKVPSQHVMETKRQLCPRSASTSTLQTQLAQPHSNGQDSKPSGCSEKGQLCPLGATWKTCAEELPCGPFFGSRRTGPLAFVGSIIWVKSR